LITIVVTMPINFVANKLWTFRAVRHHPPGTSAPTVGSSHVADGAPRARQGER